LERRAISLAPSELLLDHLRKLVVAIMVLKDLDQLSVRQGLDRNNPCVIISLVRSTHAAPLSSVSSLARL
jgi:hypothetical protein